MRDYIHVVDLALAHVAAIERQKNLEPFMAINLGSGTGTSVLELVQAFEAASGAEIKLNFIKRRDGDLPEAWANSDLAFASLGWRTKENIATICQDTWAWQLHNPRGFGYTKT